MSPWLVLVSLVALLNLGVLVAVRGHWGRSAPLLAAAAWLGSAAGDAVGAATGLEPLPIGDFHPIAASAGAQVAMIGVLLLATMGPTRRDAPPAGR